MENFSHMHATISNTTHDNIRIIAVKVGKTQKELMCEAIDLLLEKYKEHVNGPVKK